MLRVAVQARRCVLPGVRAGLAGGDLSCHLNLSCRKCWQAWC